MLAVALGLGAALSWGVADFVAGIKSRRLHVLAVLLVSQGAGLAIIAAVVAVRGEEPPGFESLALAAGSGAAGAAAVAAFYRGLAVGAMAVVAPISATAAAIPVVVGIATGDRPGPVQVAGIVLALGGVVLAAREEPGRSAPVAAGVGLALIAAAGFGCFFVLMDAASDEDVFWAILANRLTSVGLLLAAAAALRPPLPAGGQERLQVASIGLLDVTANGLFAIASTTGLVSLVSVLASLYPVVVIVLARALLGERVRRVQQAGALVALAGVIAISAG